VRQLTCTGPGVVEWREVPEPVIQQGSDALIRPVAVARCEIDPLLVLVGPTTPEGFALGHEAVAEVVDVGDAVTRAEPGQLVLPSFQVSCGACASCRAGHTANCDTYPVLSDYGMAPLSGTEYGGMLSDLVRVPHADAMLTPLPDGLDPVAVASVPDNVADGYRAVAPHLAARPGADVLVVIHGTPSIGLYAAQAAVALGAGSVTVAADDTEVLALAEAVGAKSVPSDFGRRPGRWPIVVDCGTRVEGLHHSIACTEPEGTLQSVSYYAAEPMTPMPLGRLYTLGIHVHIGRAHSAALLPEVTRLVADGRLAPERVTTATIDWEEASTRYTEPAVKLVVSRVRPPTPSAMG
jgi:alcohol dehydrogenase